MSGSAKKTNKMQEQQFNNLNNYSNTMGDRSSNEYGYYTGQRDKITNALWDKYNSAPELAGGSGGTADWYGPAADFYRSMMETGGMTDADKANYRSWTTAPIAGFYQGLKDEMARKNNATGGYIGYNSQNAKLSRDAARQGYLTAQESESGLLDMINRNKFQGASGLESSFHKGSPGSAGSAGAAGSQDYYLRQLMGLMDTKDLPYAQLQGQGYGNAADTLKYRQKGSTGSTIGKVAGGLIGTFLMPGVGTAMGANAGGQLGGMFD